jgi:hypothetical protein
LGFWGFGVFLRTVDGVLHKLIVNESNVEAIIKKIKI